MRLWIRDVGLSNRVGEMKVSMYGREDYTLVEGVTQFQYLGRTLEHTDNYWLEVHKNIGKSRSVWRRLVNFCDSRG